MPFLGKPKLIWYWTDRGFGSELLYLLNAILYAEKHKLDFKLISCYSNISSGLGWQEYFKPFAEEKQMPYPFFRLFYSVYHVGIFNFLFGLEIKLFYGLFAETNTTIWHRLYNPKFEFEYFSSSKYDFDHIQGHEALQILLKKIWQPNNELSEILSTERTKYVLSDECFAIHLRHGDKVKGLYKECDAVENKFLYDHINTLGVEFSQLYILSDDHEKFKEFVGLSHGKSILTHCEETHQGYQNVDFLRLSGAVRKKEMITLLVSIDAAVRAKYFIGPYTSNISKVIYLMRNGVGCYNSELRPFRIYN
jgi:hypothetical protein